MTSLLSITSGIFCIIIYQLLACNGLTIIRPERVIKLRTPSAAEMTDPQLTFYGIGAISGGGATSKLLQNYNKQQRDEILDFLFLPNFGASLHMLKVEIGGDSQSTEGTEASHMHYPWDQNYQRGYEWWIMKEAKRRNPNILLYALPWAFPGWVGNGTLSPYSYPALTVEYVANWLSGAKRYHNLTMDYLGIWNERNYDVNYVKLLRRELDNRGFTNVKLIVGDGDWSPAVDVLKDAQFANAVFGLGAHYPGTLSSSEARSTGKPLWASEDFSTFNNDIGSGCWARILNRNFVNGRMSSSIAWNLVASYYDNLPFPRCSLMTANEPWSGHYELTGPLWVTAHVTQFTQPGWQYLPVGAGSGYLPNGGSFVSIVSSDLSQLTIVIETMSHDHSICIRPPLPPYTVKPQNITLQLPKQFANKVKTLFAWRSQLSFNAKVASSFFQKLQPLPVINGRVSLQLNVDELLTLSTVATATRGQRPQSPPSRPFPLPYSDDFSDSSAYSEGQNPLNLVPQVGSFEISSSSKLLPCKGQALLQTVLQQPVDWCKQSQPIAVVGNYNWSNVNVSASVLVPSVNSTSGIFIAARIDQGGCEAFKAKGLFLWLFPSAKRYSLTNDLAQTMEIASGSVDVKYDSWIPVSLSIQQSTFSASIGHNRIMNRAPLPSATPSSGFAGIGTENFGLGCFSKMSIANASASDAAAAADAAADHDFNNAVAVNGAAVVRMSNLIPAARIISDNVAAADLTLADHL